MNTRTWSSVIALVVPAFAQHQLDGVGGAAGDRLGSALPLAGDQNGDGYAAVLVGSPGFNGSRGAVRCISGKFLAGQATSSTLWSITTPPVNAGAEFGACLAAVGDVTGDSSPDFVVGVPNFLLSRTDTRGALFLVDGGTRAIVGRIYGLPQTRLGRAMVAVGDPTSDLETDIAVSAPAVSNSTASLVHIVPSSAFGVSTPLASVPHASHTNGWHSYGGALASGFDYDGDGRLDLAIGAPDFGASGSVTGRVEIRDGGSLGLIQLYTPGVAGERLGASPSAGDDCDGDGIVDLLAGCPGWSGGTVADGRVRVLSGAPSASSLQVLVNCSNVLNQVSGLLFCSNVPCAAPFKDGTLCARTPTRRTRPQNSGGSTSRPDCSGVLGFELNAFIQSGADPMLVAGAEDFCQYWSRDPSSASTTSLSNGLRFLVSP